MGPPPTHCARIGIFLFGILLFNHSNAQEPALSQQNGQSAVACRPVPSPAPQTTDQALRTTVDACIAEHNLASATDWLVAWHTQRPADIERVDDIIEILLWQNRGDEALPWRRMAVDMQPESDVRQRQLAQAYMAAGRTEDAVGVQERLATANPDDLEEWETLATWAGWASLLEVRRRAMVQQARLATTGLVEIRTELGQLFAWTGHPEEALEQYSHVYQLTPDDQELGLTIAQLQAGLDRPDQAIETLLELTKDDPDWPEAQFLLAQLTHWSPRWTIARRNYRVLLRNHPTHEAKRFQDLLTAAHGPRLFVRGTASMDSNDVTRVTVESAFDVPLGARVRAGIRTEHIRMTELADKELLSSDAHAVEATVELRPGDPVWFTLAGGAETFRDGRQAPRGDINVHAAFGSFYPKLSLKHRTWASGVQAVHARIAMSTATAAIWAEVGSFEVGASAEYGWLSDGNSRTEGYGSLVFAPDLTSVIVRPKLVVGYTDFESQKVAAEPYFTQDQALTIAAGVDIGYELPGRLIATVGYAPALDVRTGTVLHGPRARVWTDIPHVGTIELTAERRGAPVYSSNVAQLTYIRRF